MTDWFHKLNHLIYEFRNALLDKIKINFDDNADILPVILTVVLTVICYMITIIVCLIVIGIVVAIVFGTLGKLLAILNAFIDKRREARKYE